MDIRTHIMNWLGISDLFRSISDHTAYQDREFQKILNQIAVHNRALGRIIAKVDPQYNRSEFDPERRAESDKLADEVIARLHAEHKASNPYG